jgi:hypothetical protein
MMPEIQSQRIHQGRLELEARNVPKVWIESFATMA